MTKLLLNSGTTTLYNAAGSPIPPGMLVLDDELDEAHESLYADGTLVYVRPSDVPEKDALLSAAAEEHLAGGNADAASSDDASVKTTPKAKGGQS